MPSRESVDEIIECGYDSGNEWLGPERRCSAARPEVARGNRPAAACACMGPGRRILAQGRITAWIKISGPPIAWDCQIEADAPVGQPWVDATCTTRNLSGRVMTTPHQPGSPVTCWPR